MTLPLAFLRASRVASLLLLLLPIGAAASDASSATEVMRRVFAWQVAHPWSTQHAPEHRWGTRGWVQGAFLTGVMEAYRATGDEAYVAYARTLAAKNDWQLGARLRHADDHVVGQTYLELHALAPADGQIDSIQRTFDELLAAPVRGDELWWWCDALYMSPPTFAKLSQATGDPRYANAMHRWFWEVYAALYDPEDRLFYRDHRFAFPSDGKKIFWSRGNGWVLAGLARLIDSLPAEHVSLPRYVALFRALAARVVELQPPDGLWRADLLRPEAAHGEASGSGFFCYALAWGINRGHLPEPGYRAAAVRTWEALQDCVDDDGRLGWVQPIGFAPDAYDATTSQEYGAGAFLAAGAQMLPLLAGN